MMKCQAFVFASMLFFAASLPVHAQTPQYWDTNADGGLGGTGTSTPDGTWDTGTTPNWNVNADGTGGTTTWTDGNDAVFSAGSDGGGDYTITVGAPLPSAHNITIEEGGNVTFTGGQITLTGTTPTITSSATLTKFNNVIGGSAGVTFVGNSANFIDLAGANTYSGATIIGNGTVGTIVRLGASGAVPDGSVLTVARGTQPGTFQLNGHDETVRSLSSVGSGGTAGLIALGSNTLTLSDQVGDTFTTGSLFSTAGGGKIVKNGAGSLTLNGASNNFVSGEFIVNSGNITIGANNCFGTNANNSKLTMNGGALTTAANMSMNTQNMDIGGSFAANMNTTGNLQFLGNAGNGPVVLKASNPTITVNPDSTTSRPVVINPNQAAGLQNGIFILAGPISDDGGGARGFTKAGDGMLTIANPSNTYTGETTILQGILRLSKQIGANATVGDGRLGDGTHNVNLSGGTLNYNGSINTGDTTRTLTVPNPIHVTANSVISYYSTTQNLTGLNDINFVFTNNDISGTGGTLTLKNDGVCTSNGNSCAFRPTFSGAGFDFSRPVLINSQVDDATTGSLATRSTVLQSANTTGTQTWSGALGGTGVFRRSAAGGNTVLSAANTFSGGTIVDGGTLTVMGSSATFGAGDVTVNAGSASISAAVANAILDTAKLTLLGGGTASFADTGFIALAAGINERVGTLVLGASTQVNGTYGATGSGAAHILDDYFSGPGIITVGAAGLLGDFNSDGKVDAGDYATWRKNEVANAALANDNGLGTQAARFSLWRANFGNPPGAGSGGGLSNSAVPEPGTFSLLICAVGSGLIASSRRRRS